MFIEAVLFVFFPPRYGFTTVPAIQADKAETTPSLNQTFLSDASSRKS